MKFNKKQCIEDARKYKGIVSWKNASPDMYQYIKNLGLIDELYITNVFSSKPKKYWTYEKSKQEALKYSSVKEWHKLGKGSFGSARKNGWYEEFSSFFEGGWTESKAKFDAKKYLYRGQWAKASKSGYQYAQRAGILDNCCKHMKDGCAEYKKNKLIWTKEACFVEAKKYQTKNDWKHQSGGSYVASCVGGWKDEACSHMTPRFKWTKDMCFEKAKLYSTRQDFRKNDYKAYGAACEYGWLAEITSHMPERSIGDLREKRCVKFLFKKISNKITKKVNIEKALIDRIKPDLTLKINGKIVLVEVKHDESDWKKERIDRQLSKYIRIGKSIFGKNFHKCFLCSPNGRYGLTFEQLIKELTVLKESK